MAVNYKKNNLKKAITFVNLNHIPGPRNMKYFNYVKLFQKDILGAFTGTHEEYGDIASFPWPMNSIIIYSPSFYKQVLIDDNRSYAKGEQVEEVKVVVGEGLGTNNDFNLWKRNRAIVSKEFNKNSTLQYSPIVKNIIDKNVASISDTTDIDLLYKKLMMQIVSKIFLGADLDDKMILAVNEAVELVSIISYKRIFQFFPLPYWIPTKAHRQFKKKIDLLDKMVYDLIAKTKNNLNGNQLNVLSRLVQAKDSETGESLTDLEIRDEVMTILIAGFETSSYTLTWATALLAKYHDIQEKLYLEVSTRTLDELLEENSYFECFIQEVMRLCPAIPILSRKTIAETKLGDITIPKNTNVVIPIYVTQRSEKYVKDPLSFDPERMRDRSLLNNHVSNPFSKGPRRCIGELFAKHAMAMALKEILTKYKLTLKSEFPKETAFVTLKPQSAILVNFVKR